MAEFAAPSQDVLPPDYTNASQGPRAAENDALGRLFGNVAQTADLGIKEADRFNREKITDDIMAGVEDVQSEFGVDEATSFETDAEEGGPSLPPALDKAGQQLGYLQNAYVKGGIKESHYWARLNVMVRQLRAKYPGYRQDIDSMVAGVVGAKPANALQNALFGEWDEAKRAAASQQDSFGKLVDWAAKDGTLPPDYYARLSGDSPYTEIELQSFIADKKRYQSSMQERSAANALAASQYSLDKTGAESGFRQDSTTTVQQALSDATKPLGKTWKELNANLSGIIDVIKNGGTPDPLLIEQMKGGVAQLQKELPALLEQIYLKPFGDDVNENYGKYIDAETKQREITAAMTPVTVLANALAGDNPFAVAKSLSNYIEASKNSATADLVKSVPMGVKLSAAQELLGPDLSSYLLEKADSSGTPLSNTIIDWFLLDASTGGGSTVDDFLTKAEATGLPADSYNSMMNIWTRVAKDIENGDVPLEVIENNVRFMFGPPAEQVMSRMDAASERLWYTKVASPEVTKQMLALKDAGGEDSWNLYQNWVKAGFLRLFDQDMDTLNQVNSRLGASELYSGKVVWDRDTSSFRMDDVGYGTKANFLDPGGVFTSLNRMVTGQMGGINSLNAAIQVIKPILEENGGNVEAELARLLEVMGFSEAEGVQKAMFDELLAVYNEDNAGTN